MGFITSNSWLDVAYGYELQKYLVNNFKIIAILESRCEPWFEDAAVNTVVTILERCSDKAQRNEHIVSFVKVKKKLAELIPWDAKVDAMRRWTGLDALAQKIESAADSEKCVAIDKNGKKRVLEGVATVEDDDFRIRLVKQSDLKAQLDKETKTAKWGQYLRAPQVFFDIMADEGVSFIPLNNIAEVQSGCYTGINEFFYLDSAKVKHWNLEDRYLIPVIRSPRETPLINVDISCLATRLLLCKDDKTSLKSSGSINILKYITWGESQVTVAKQKVAAGIPWHKVPTVINRKPGWWAIPRCHPAQIFLSYVVGDVFSQRYSEQPIISDRCFHMVIPKLASNTLLLSAVLNSSLVSLFIEMAGRVNLGEGALKFETDDAKKLLIPNVALFSQPELIIKAYKALFKRAIKPVMQEVKMADRRELDSLILEAMGLDPSKYLQPIYDGLTELVRERIELAAMRKKQKQFKSAHNVEKMVAQVTQEIMNEGIKKFPDDFLSSKPKPQECTVVSVPNVKLRVGLPMLTQQEVIGEGYSYQAPGLAAAKYIVYAQRPDEYVVNLPNDEIIVNKAVIAYEQYVKGLFQKLNQELLNRTFDHKQAETLSRRIFQDLNLPVIS